MIGGSSSYGERLFVFGKASRSEGFNKKSAMALTGVIKLRSKDVDLSILSFFFATNQKISVQNLNKYSFSYLFSTTQCHLSIVP